MNLDFERYLVWRNILSDIWRYFQISENWSTYILHYWPMQHTYCWCLRKCNWAIWGYVHKQFVARVYYSQCTRKPIHADSTVTAAIAGACTGRLLRLSVAGAGTGRLSTSPGNNVCQAFRITVPVIAKHSHKLSVDNKFVAERYLLDIMML